MTSFFNRRISLSLIALILLNLMALTLMQPTAQAKDGSLDDLDAWSGWGHDPFNTRFNPLAKEIKPSNVDKLQLKWSFVFPNAVSASSQPAIVGDTLYVGSWNAKFYALNAETGKLKWTFDSASVTGQLPVGANGIRTAPTIEDGVVYFGDLLANIYGVDAKTGSLRWVTKVEQHPLARITGSPLVWRGKVYVGVSSAETGVALDPTYPCCTFRGSMVALDGKTGAIKWKYYTVSQPAVPTGELNAFGTPLYGPSGAAVWGTPALDPIQGLLYFGSGQNYSKPTTNRSDSLIALDLNTGQERWANQLTPNDRWNVSCNPEAIGFPPGAGPNCPNFNSGTDLDYDIGAAPNVFVTVKNGRLRTLVGVGQKSGVYHALDARTGEIVWQTQLSIGGVAGAGGIQWGSSWDGERLYVSTHQANPGTLFALDPATGAILWNNKNPANGCTTGGATGDPACKLALPAASSVIPGLVFLGSWDGKFRAYDSKKGTILWQYDTKRSFTGTNGVVGAGGSLNGSGASIVDGIVYVNSGYQPFPGAGMPGNVLLAFKLK